MTSWTQPLNALLSCFTAQRPKAIAAKEMAGHQFQVQELNPFLECHLHARAASLEIASEEAKRIAKMIGRKTQVLSEYGEVLTEVNP